MIVGCISSESRTLSGSLFKSLEANPSRLFRVRHLNKYEHFFLDQTQLIRLIILVLSLSVG